MRHFGATRIPKSPVLGRLNTGISVLQKRAGTQNTGIRDPGIVIPTQPPSTLSDLVDCYNSTFSQLLNIHATLKSKIIRTKPRNPWYTQALKNLNVILNVSVLVLIDLKNFCSATNHYHAAIIKAKRTYNSSLISSSFTNPRQLWKNINTLLHCSSLPALASYDSLSLFSSDTHFAIIHHHIIHAVM